MAGLSCTMNVCRTLEPSCRWSIDCLTKLKALHPQEGVGYEVGRFLRKLVEQPHPMDCEDMPERIAHLLNNRPWEWKKACGAPPVSGVIRPTDRRLPFRIVDYKVKESQVPADEKPEIHQRHSTHPDLCKAWVKFVLIRPYQGFVVAQIKEQYDCRAATAEALKADPDARPTCSKTRPYPVTDRRYIPLHPAGSEFSWNFYFSTPPEVCRKPGLTDKSFPRGCFCLGIDTSTVALIAEEDPFLFKDEMASPRRVPD